MKEDSMSEKLSNTIKELSNIEVNEISLLIATIKKNLTDLINKNMELLENEFIAKCDFYGKSSDSVSKEKEEILKGYKEEFDRIASKFEEEYMNFALELQEIQESQKTTIIDMIRIIDSKDQYIESPEYEDFLDNIQTLEIRKNNCLVKAEFDELVDFLDTVEDPIDIYNKEIDALAEKYIRYCGLEEACIEKIKDCNVEAEKVISSVMKYDVGQLALINKKSIFSFFSKLFRKITGGKKFEKEYLLKKRENIEKIKVDTNKTLENIDKEIDNILILLDVYNSKIKQAFNQAV